MNDSCHSPLLTDLYQLTMLQTYLERGMERRAVFEFFVRHLPPARGFLIAAGLEQALSFLEDLRFTEQELEWIRKCGRFAPDFTARLENLRFDGDVYAMPEGTPFFADEPILQVVAPLPVAQLVESRLINILHFQTLVASKAARCRLTAPNKLLVDFGMRRAHGAEAALFAARAGYLAGLDGTATVLANPLYGIPVFGTMAHSFVLAHESETAAFESFARSHPDNVVLLIDTWDTEAAAHKVVTLAPRLQKEGIVIKAVRLDSGDLVSHARQVRKILDQGGLNDTGIFCSGNLDEYRIAELLASGAPVDGFGVGTLLDTSADAPYLDCAYKLVEYDGRPVRKHSEGKATWPGRKQVYRFVSEQGRWLEDRLCLAQEEEEGTPLLQPVMRKGKRLKTGQEPLSRIRTRVQERLDTLPGPALRIEKPKAPSVSISKRLRELAAELDRNDGTE